MKKRSIAACACAALALTGAAPAPDELSLPSRVAPMEESEPLDIAASPIASDALNDLAPLEEFELKEHRGGQTIVIGNQTLTAINSGSVLNGDYSAGAVTLSDNALSSFTGVGNLAINTGAQVNLQSGMSIIINVGQ